MLTLLPLDRNNTLIAYYWLFLGTDSNVIIMSNYTSFMIELK